jgi:predicted nucleotidyltransferase
LQKKLRQQGFQDDVNENTVICRMQLDGVLKVDFMPDDPNILGFSNRWYPQAMETAQLYQLNDDTQISLIQPEFFVGTKLEAYKGRGRNDALSSHDIEDLLNVFDGRPSIIEEIQHLYRSLKLISARS